MVGEIAIQVKQHGAGLRARESHGSIIGQEQPYTVVVAVSVCPAAVVRAPRAIVWRLLAEPSSYPTWSNAELVSVDPPGPVSPGQQIEFRGRALGRSWRVMFKILEVDAEAGRIRIDVHLPLSIINHEVVTCDSVADGEVLVRFN